MRIRAQSPLRALALVLLFVSGGPAVEGSSRTDLAADGLTDLAEWLSQEGAVCGLDSDYGSGGIVLQNYRLNDVFQDVARDTNGRIVAVGSATDVAGSGGRGAVVARFLANGTPDPTFGVGGVTMASIGFDTQLNAVALQPIGGGDYKIIAAGFAEITGCGYRFVTVRYDSDGTLDTSFDGDGFRTDQIASEASCGAFSSHAGGVTVQPDGKIVVVGNAHQGGAGNYDWGIVRYEANGALDTTFDSDGVAYFSFGSSSEGALSVVMQPDPNPSNPDRILVSGSGGPSDGMPVARYLSNGSLDTSFGSAGIARTTTPGFGTQIALDTAGNIVVGGSAVVVPPPQPPPQPPPHLDFAATRYSADGVLDPTFGIDGISIIPVSSTTDYAQDAELLPDGRILLAGFSGGGDVVLVRLEENGVADSTFGTSGVQLLDIEGGVDEGIGLVLDGTAAVVSGAATVAGSLDALLLRYEASCGGAEEPEDQTITVTPDAPTTASFESTFDVGATASSGLDVEITTSGGCSGSGSGPGPVEITMTSGTTDCVVHFNQAGNEAFNPAPEETRTILAELASQTITVTTPAPASAAFNESFAVAATASSGLDVAITTSGGCDGSGSGSATITMTSGTTTCVVNYNQTGNANYSAATLVTSDTTAIKATAIVTLSNLSQTYDGAPKPVGVSTTPGGLAVSVTYNSLATAPTNAGSYTVAATIGAPDSANYTGGAGGTLTIARASQTITVTTSAPATAGYNATFNVAATASSGLPVVITTAGSCAGSGSGSATVTITSGNSNCTVRYSQAGDANYLAAAQVSQRTTAQKASQTITVTQAPPPTATLGSSFTVAATASSGLPVSVSTSGSTCSASGFTITFKKKGTCTVTFAQSGNTNYSAAPKDARTTTVQ